MKKILESVKEYYRNRILAEQFVFIDVKHTNTSVKNSEIKILIDDEKSFTIIVSRSIFPELAEYKSAWQSTMCGDDLELCFSVEEKRKLTAIFKQYLP